MRKLSFVAGAVAIATGVACAPAGAVTVKDPRDAAGPLDIAKVSISQSSRQLVWQVRDRSPLRPLVLDRHPDPADPDARYLCLRMRVSGRVRQLQLCLGKPGIGHRSRVGTEVLGADGSVVRQGLVRVHETRVDDDTVSVSLRPEAAGLRPHRYRWRVVSNWSGPACAVTGADPCADLSPDTHQGRFTLYPVRVTGCVDSGPTPVFHGPRTKKVVALTFDDGPSSYTPQILSILARKHVHATFFEIGDQVPLHPDLPRKILAGGNELGDHSLHHESEPGYASMAETQSRIESVTGFRPCLFRPPYGAYDSRVVGDARSLGMTTVIWDVDPTDWSRPGTGAIYSRVVSATQPGSIVLMHDGGGDRSETVAALPNIIDTLRARGYSFATVSQLLGQRMIWSPVR
jgi:peptidoglycan/xylan/chitin deacetylase (PgdA/CDA1 family)